MNRRTFGIGVGAGVVATVLILIVVVVASVLIFGLPVGQFFAPTETGASAGLSADNTDYEVIAEDLQVPWEVVVLDDGRYLVTERSGDLLLLDDGEEHVLEQFDELDNPPLGEGGLLGIAIHPNFVDNNYLYVYQTVDRESVENTVRRYEVDFDSMELRNEEVIVDGIPSDRFHNGGRIAFGPDEQLYVTTGDATNSDLAQDRDSLAGKVLRLTDDGEIPEDNPFGNAVYSYGHRNPQGLAWDDAGRLWVTEHGADARDELNLVEAGENYGWPAIRGSETDPDMRSPIYHSGEYETWAPAGTAAVDGSVFFAGLRGERLYEAAVDGERVNSFTAHFSGDFGRIRAVTVGPDEEYLYFTTSNTDGRGDAGEGDDRLIRVPLAAF
ncbi:PQQ-dependent sugar dehydrogenase [Halovenus sp. HT40]|uniref:PQQ-dependent sugar dehydrogenase n=1 Tax=Halovenus sp. HT40 TaxID=3126691 RepID=UPI00300F787C